MCFGKGDSFFFSSFPNFSNFERGCAGGLHGSYEPIGGNKVIPSYSKVSFLVSTFLHREIPSSL